MYDTATVLAFGLGCWLSAILGAGTVAYALIKHLRKPEYSVREYYNVRFRDVEAEIRAAWAEGWEISTDTVDGDATNTRKNIFLRKRIS